MHVFDEGILNANSFMLSKNKDHCLAKETIESSNMLAFSILILPTILFYRRKYRKHCPVILKYSCVCVTGRP